MTCPKCGSQTTEEYGGISEPDTEIVDVGPIEVCTNSKCDWQSEIKTEE